MPSRIADLATHFPSRFVRPEGIAIACYGVSSGLIALSALEVVTRGSQTGSRDLPVLLVILFVICTAELFISTLRVFVPVLIVQLVVVVAVTVTASPSLPLVEINTVAVLALSVIPRFPARYSVPVCLTVMVVPPLSSYFSGSHARTAFLPLGIELVVLLLAHQAISYRERFVVAREQLDHERESVRHLSAANDSLLRQLPEMKEVSAEKERLHITRELHDTLGYSMTNIVMIMNAAQFLIGSDPEKVREYCSRTKELASSTMEETRVTLYKVREIGRHTPDDPAIFFDHLCRDFQEATGVTAECHPGNLVHRLPKRVFDTLLRTVQVGFINALRHGKASRIELYIWVDQRELIMTIWNAAANPPDEVRQLVHEGIGLSGVRERIEELDGMVEASYVRGGFNLVIRIPEKELMDANHPSSDS